MATFDTMSVVLLSFAIVAAWFAPTAARRWRLNQERRAVCADKFYEAAREVMKHEAASDAVRKTVVALGDAMTQPSAIRHFALLWVMGRLTPNDAARSPFAQDMDGAPVELQRLVAMSIAYSLFASTYLTLFSGWLVRNLLLRPIGMPKK